MKYNQEEEMMSCRICYEKDETCSKLISPCLCKGSSKWTHIHCLETWQDYSLQAQKPKKAYICSICLSPFTYPSWYSLATRRLRYSVTYYSNLVMIIFSLTWISLVMVPCKLFFHSTLFLLSIGHSKNCEPISDIQGGGVLLVSSKRVSKSSIFYKSVIVLLEHSPSGSKGVIINIDSDTLGPQNDRDELITVGKGGPIDLSQYNVFHDSHECSTYSEKIIPKILTNNSKIRNIILLPRNATNDDVFQSKSIYFAEYVQAISVIQDVTLQRNNNQSGGIKKSLSNLLSYIGVGDNKWRQSVDQDLKSDPDVTHFRVARGHTRWKPRQLDAEIKAGLWLVVPLRNDYIFNSTTYRNNLWNYIISQIEMTESSSR